MIDFNFFWRVLKMLSNWNPEERINKLEKSGIDLPPAIKAILKNESRIPQLVKGFDFISRLPKEDQETIFRIINNLIQEGPQGNVNLDLDQLSRTMGMNIPELMNFIGLFDEIGLTNTPIIIADEPSQLDSETSPNPSNVSNGSLSKNNIKLILDELEEHMENRIDYRKNDLYNEWKDRLHKLIELCESIVKEQPTNERAWILLGDCYGHLSKRIEDEINCYKKALEINPLNEEVWQDLGYLYWQTLEDAPNAIYCFKKVLELNPDNDLVWNALGFIYKEEIGNSQEAIKCFEKYLDCTKENVDGIMWAEIGSVYFDLENYGKAIESFENAIEDGVLNEGSNWVLYDLGKLYEKQGNWQKELELFFKRIKQNSEDKIANENFIRLRLKLLNNLKEIQLKGWHEILLKDLEKKIGIDFNILEALIENLIENRDLPASLNKKSLVFSGEINNLPIQEIIILPGQKNKAITIIENFFKDLKNEVIAMLTYIDKTTFRFLDEIPKACGIKIITSKIADDNECKNFAMRCANNRPFFGIIKINKLHERWIGSNTSFFIDLGTDLKLTALGSKSHTINILPSEYYQERIKEFYNIWNSSLKDLKRCRGDDFEKEIFFQKSSS